MKEDAQKPVQTGASDEAGARIGGGFSNWKSIGKIWSGGPLVASRGGGELQIETWGSCSIPRIVITDTLQNGKHEKRTSGDNNCPDKLKLNLWRENLPSVENHTASSSVYGIASVQLSLQRSMSY
jgi:hypothetical protein